MQAEQLFFSALEECLGATHVLRKGRDVQDLFDRHGARLLSDHTAMGFEQPERVALDEIYQLLLGAPGARRAVDLTRHIDGILSLGYPLGPCIVEFDEEQHFSSFRYVTFGVLARTIEVNYDVTLYKRCCQGGEYFALSQEAPAPRGGHCQDAHSRRFP